MRRTWASDHLPNVTRGIASGLLAVLLIVAPTLGQATPEGTVITNTADVSWTDANNNSYTAVSASVNVTVGFVAGIDVTGQATATPSSPGTDTLTFTVSNVGNGPDTA